MASETIQQSPTSTPTPAVIAPRPRLFDGIAINARPLALMYRVVACALIVTGLIRILAIFTDKPDWNSLLFYTVMSNILCLVWMILLAVRTLHDIRTSGVRGTSTPSARWSGAIMMAITVTMLIYLVVLVPDSFQQAGDYVPFSLTDNLVHIITPCLLIADWLLFVRKGALRWIDPLLWVLIPYAYMVFAYVFGALGGLFGPKQKYPYPFMNIDLLGLGAVVMWVVALTVAMVVVGYVYVAIDRALGRLSTRR